MEMKLRFDGKTACMASLLIALIGAGVCSSAAESPQQAATFTPASDGQSGAGGSHRGGMFQQAPDQPERSADLMAKVVAVNGTDVTIQPSTMDPSAWEGGGQRNKANGDENRQVQVQSGDNGDAASQRRGGSGREMQFADEKQHIQIPEGAPIYTMSWTDGTMAFKQIAVKELKADEVITVWMNPDKQGQASYVTIRNGGKGFSPPSEGNAEAPLSGQ